MIAEKFIDFHKKENYPPGIYRTKLGSNTAKVGVGLNILLAISKIILGIISNSISIVADAFNNLTDVAASLISVIGFYISAKPSDKDHPYGHGRTEYLATMSVAVVVLIVGLTFLKSSIEGFISPRKIEFSVISFLILILTIFVKFFMYKFYKKIGKEIVSSTLRASALDSIGDVFITACVVISFFSSQFTEFPVDAIASIIVSVMILKSGIELVGEMANTLIGEKIDEELSEKVFEIIDIHPQVMGHHDFFVHSYGPNNNYATIDLMVKNNLTLEEADDLFHQIEHEVWESTGIRLTIRLDLEREEDKEIKRLEKIMDNYVKNEPLIISYHDADVRKIKDELHVTVHLVMDGEKIKTVSDEDKVKEKLKKFLFPKFGKGDYEFIIDRIYE